MAGAYCRYCGNRCFVLRNLPDGSWSGHMATCREGMAHDREVTGYDYTTAINPLSPERREEVRQGVEQIANVLGEPPEQVISELRSYIVATRLRAAGPASSKEKP